MAINRAGPNTLTKIFEKIKTVFDGKLDKSGGTMTGALILNGAPTENFHAATKKYVDDGISNQTSETWTFTLADGSSVTKTVVLK